MIIKSLIKFCILIIVLCSLSCKNGRQDKTEHVIKNNQAKITDDSTKTLDINISDGFCYYIPIKENKDIKLPLVLLFDPHAKGDISIKKYLTIAEEMDFIIAASLISKNGMAIDDIRIHTTKILKEIKKSLPVDTSQIIFAGFSGGGRVATEMARMFENVTGIISCGAANPVVNKSGIKNTIICGNEDFNYIECVSVSLNQQNNPNFLFLGFDGKHEWPSAESMKKAVYFTLKGLGSNSDFTLSNQEIWYLNRENQIRSELAQSFTSKNINWWIDKIEELKQNAKSTDILENKSSKRLLAYIGILSYSYTKGALELKNINLTDHCLKIYEYIEPDNPDMLTFKKQYKLLEAKK